MYCPTCRSHYPEREKEVLAALEELLKRAENATSQAPNKATDKEGE
jgi:hypothetical protein